MNEYTLKTCISRRQARGRPFATFAVPLAIIAAGCGGAQSGAHHDAHGRVNAHGDAPGHDWTIAPSACLSGMAVMPPTAALVFTSADGGPAAIKIVSDPQVGARVQFIRLVNGYAVTQTLERSQCTTLNMDMGATGWTINGVVQVHATAQIDCTADGVNIAGTVDFRHCGVSSEAINVMQALLHAPTQEDTTRLAALPHVPATIEVPPMPPALRGMTFRAQGHLTGAPTGDETVEHGEQVCAASFEQTFAAAGWTAVHDPQTHVDVVIDGHCTGHVSWAAHGSLIEFIYPASDGPGLTFSHDGAVIDSVPRGPANFVCEAAGATPDAQFQACVVRAGQMADARIFAAVAASQPLAQLASHRHHAGR